MSVDRRERDMRCAAILEQRHRQSCDEMGDHHAEVDTCFSVGADAIRALARHASQQKALSERARAETATAASTALGAPLIDWALLAQALGYYGGNGYRVVNLPWLADLDAIKLTCPDEVRVMTVPGHGGLVGSAEQAFLMLDRGGHLGKGAFVALTPCFRDEPVVDALHQKTFMKVELYRNDDTSPEALEAMIRLAQGFFRRHANAEIAREITEDGIDLTLGGVEIGSYGLREAGGLRWVYGTGLAEPRFSTARHG